MTGKELYEVDGVIAAVKCMICDTLYRAESDEYLAFYGSVSVGLGDVIIGVTPPQKPKKRAIRAVCRSPECIAKTVQKMLGCDGEKGDADKLWAQALTVWAQAAGHKLVESSKTRTTAPAKGRRKST